AKKLVLLSIVAVRPPSGRLIAAVIPPSVSPSAIIAPPCSTPRRLHRSSRTGSSASPRSGERCRTFTPRDFGKAGNSGIAIVAVTCLMRPHSTPRDAARVGGETRSIARHDFFCLGQGELPKTRTHYMFRRPTKFLGARSSAG